MPPPPDPAGRVRALEELLGDPQDAAHPLGHEAVLAADRQRELPPGGEELLSGFGLHEELVPAALGGRLDRLDTAARLLRAVFRRDFSLGLGFGAASLVAAVAVWAHGSNAQQARIARLLLDGGRISVMFHDIAHGNDFSTSSVTAFPDGAGGLLLQGHKAVVTNAARADALVVLARTGAGRAGGAHSAVLVERDRVPAGSLRDLPRYRGEGIRGCPVGGVEFTACPAPADALLGTAGGGTEVMLRCLQVTRPLIPAMALGCADTALRTVVALAGSGSAHGVRSLDARYTRAAVAGAFLDLLLCDCLLLAAIRSLHVTPGDSSMPSAAAKYLVPRVLQEATDDLAAILGPRVHREEGAYGTFRKHLRDLAGMPPGHAGAAASLASLLPQLPSLARRSWSGTPGSTAAPDELFHPDGPLPPWNPAALALAARHDPLAAALRDAPARLAGLPGPDIHRASLAALVRQLADELAVLGKECRQLPEGDPALLANPYGFALAERYTLLAAAGACLGVWLSGTGPAGPTALLGVLGRIAVRLGLPVPAETADAAAAAMTEVLARCSAGRTLDLYDEPLAGGGTT